VGTLKKLIELHLGWFDSNPASVVASKLASDTIKVTAAAG